MELPECPVCLQVYNNKDTIPRVLACGHSACEACLPHLPQRLPDTIRCPACNQLIRYPQHQSPSALPKNIDLLSFIDQQQHDPTSSLLPQSQPQKHSNQTSQFLPPFCSQHFYSTWNNWILPADAISMQTTGKDPFILNFGLRDNQFVSLLFVGACNLKDPFFDFSYTVRIFEALKQLKERESHELCLILRVFSTEFRVCCKAYGLWMNLEDGSLFMVCERLHGHLGNKLRELRNDVDCLNGDALIEDVKRNSIICRGISGFVTIGMALCEALIGLHSTGLVSGCLALSCFSYDDLGHIFLDPNEVLVIGRVVRKCIGDVVASHCQGRDDLTLTSMLKIRAFVSPEVLFKLFQNVRITSTSSSSGYSVGYYSDVWSLGCVLVSLLVGDSFAEKSFNDLYNFLPEIHEESFCELYRGWVERLSSTLETILGAEFVSLHQIICSCLELDPENRPHVTDVWRCIRGLLIEPQVDILVSVEAEVSMKNMVHCIALGNLCFVLKESEKQSQRQKGPATGMPGSGQAGNGEVQRDLVDGLCLGNFESINLEGHLDCITGLAVGGGYLFSSSFDKTVHMWSLQDFSHVQSFTGHEHRVMAVIFVDASEPFCISADSGGGIFIWDAGISGEKEPLKKWYEPKDWRYSGIHALAVSGTEYVYTGSGDKSIKAWSLQEYTLTCTMTGHKSVVSSLKVFDGVLYSGSWDGSIHLWSLHDHSLLTVLGDDTPGNVASVLSLSVNHRILVAAHENGCVKIWRNDVLSTSIEAGNDAILSLDMEGKWLFMGGWDKAINVQELSGDEFPVETRSIGSIACNSVVTALLYWEGMLFAGFADKTIKVYYYNS